jgi:zinc protease
MCQSSPLSLWQIRQALLAALLLGLAACSEAPAPAAGTGSAAETAPPAAAGYTLLEEVAAGTDDIVIPYSKYRLDNGLTVIIHEDHSDPLIHVDVTYHVGSSREEARRSGFAHFFEHMMFQGSEHVADEEHIRIISEVGGTMNGTTDFDRTNYFATVPSNQLETMFWLESDRMGYFLDAVTQEKFETQRATVKNERNQSYENSPYGLWTEKTFMTMFPPEHPYSWMPIGFMDDLDAATLDDLKQFFLRWYGPNNATLTVGGNVDKQQILDLAVRYFGEIPAGPDVLPAPKTPAVLDADRYVSYIDPNIRFPALLISYPTVPLDHPDRVALEALIEIISIGRKSYFYKEFVLTQKAIQAQGFPFNLELAGLTTFFVLPFPGTPLAEFEADIRNVFATFTADSISDDDILIYKATQEANLIRSLASVSGKVSQLAANQTFRGNPNQIGAELAAIRALTKEDVIRVFDTYIKDKPAVYLSVVPPTAPDIVAQADNFPAPERLPRLDGGNLALEQRVAGTSFDRALRPEPPANPLVTMPQFWEQPLDNGIAFIGTRDTEVPLVSLRLVFEGGHLLEDPAQYGIASLTAEMMNEGTANFSAEDFEKELDKLGSSISVSAGNETTTISMQSLERNLDATLALLEERLFNSAFTQQDLDRIKQQFIESLEAEKEDPGAIAQNVYRELIYGDEHAFSVSAIGTVATLEGITLEDVQAFSRQSLSAPALKVTVVGDVPQEDVIAKLGFLRNLPAEAVSLRSQPATPQLAGGTLYLVDKPGAAQSEIRIGYMGTLTYDATGEYFERYLMNYVLGGAFNSRINLNLREDKGYSYGARSAFNASKLPGPFTASASVRSDATADSVVQFINEISAYREGGITPAELQFTKDAIGQSEALDYETPGQKASLLEQIITYDLQSDFVRRQQNLITNLTVERVNELARTHLPVANMIILVVGDKAAINDSLVALGYPIVELDAEANPL